MQCICCIFSEFVACGPQGTIGDLKVCSHGSWQHPVKPYGQDIEEQALKSQTPHPYISLHHRECPLFSAKVNLLLKHFWELHGSRVMFKGGKQRNPLGFYLPCFSQAPCSFLLEEKVAGVSLAVCSSNLLISSHMHLHVKIIFLSFQIDVCMCKGWGLSPWSLRRHAIKNNSYFHSGAHPMAYTSHISEYASKKPHMPPSTHFILSIGPKREAGIAYLRFSLTKPIPCNLISHFLFHVTFQYQPIS